MAIPRIFVSSTCFDLAEIRYHLGQFIESLGFESVLSENGDVCFHPDKHTHEACVNEVENCNLFILIIGGRFGGQFYPQDSNTKVAEETEENLNSLSITNVEFLEAKARNIPTFVYIKKDVYHDHHFYSMNKNKGNIGDFDFPSIEKNKYAENIFKFIDTIRNYNINNGFETFENYKDIEAHLRKQWAGLFFEMLKERSVRYKLEENNKLIETVKGFTEKTEALVESLFRKSYAIDAESEIRAIEIRIEAEMFFQELCRPSARFELPNGVSINRGLAEVYAVIEPKGLTWREYVERIQFDYKAGTKRELDNKVSKLAMKLAASALLSTLPGIGVASFGLKGLKSDLSIFESHNTRFVSNELALERHYQNGVFMMGLEDRVKLFERLIDKVPALFYTLQSAAETIEQAGD